ncbi:hypothetical protein [Microcoleus sp. FACHB-672]|uniref:hypothetical protein n=1 Tax=Microcoleus sp. FACHB-672 TaxID=2692825 RepID=UPI001A7EC2B2|nr:hypothetical protein [Microcoleus sp. FACHB-672]
MQRFSGWLIANKTPHNKQKIIVIGKKLTKLKLEAGQLPPAFEKCLGEVALSRQKEQ